MPDPRGAYEKALRFEEELLLVNGEPFRKPISQSWESRQPRSPAYIITLFALDSRAKLVMIVVAERIPKIELS